MGARVVETQAPIDRNLIEPSLLTKDELKWLNDYHTEVKANIGPLLKADPKALAFLEKATEPLSQPGKPKTMPKFCL